MDAQVLTVLKERTKDDLVTHAKFHKLSLGKGKSVSEKIALAQLLVKNGVDRNFPPSRDT